MASLDATEAKAQLRLTTQRLGQLQEKKHSQRQIIRGDIATLLRQGNISLARAKAQNLIQDDILSDLLDTLELHVRLLLERFYEIDQIPQPTPPVVEAASSIIFASPHVDSKDLNSVREIIIQRLGPDFARSATGNYDNHVSLRVMQTLCSPPPSATDINDYLIDLAVTYGVQWRPEPQRQEILNDLSELLDPGASPVVDLLQLRKLCSQGIPDDPPWLRPRIWKIFFGILPTEKASWNREMQNHRESYYDLVRRLLEPFSTLPPPTSPLGSMDTSLLNASKQLARVPKALLSSIEDEPELSHISPLDPTSPDDIKIHCASNLDYRLRVIQDQRAGVQASGNAIPMGTPEIRVEVDNNGKPGITLSQGAHHSNHTTTLLSSNSHNQDTAGQNHSTALLRLLYLHSCINPANLSPHIPSILIPVYSVVLQEIEPQDLAHAEADTFWLFEALIGEFSELEDEEGGTSWMKKLSERLAWADEELSANLNAKGLDPALPHYSYRWLAPLLTQTLPLHSVILIWDALFSRPKGDREQNPKLEYLLDVCTSMLIRARTAIFRLGRPKRNSRGLWGEDTNGVPPLSPLRPWELSDAFMEGMSLLQHYPVEAAGGTSRLLQMASELSLRREEARAQKSENRSFRERLKVTMWKGFTNQASSPEESPPSDDSSSDENSPDDGNETETLQAPKLTGITSRLATTVWRGITNQSSMDPPPTPLTPRSPSLSPSPSPSPSTSPSIVSPEESFAEPNTTLQVPSSIWSYAEKLKESDTVANLAKVSSNWRAKAMLSGWGMNGGNAKQTPEPEPSSPTEPPSHSRGSSLGWAYPWKTEERRPSSLPDINRTDAYSPPPRPAHFRQPRDSWLPQQPPDFSALPNSPQMSPLSDSFLSKTHKIRASLASLSLSTSPPPKSGPRPLLLNSSSLITHPPPSSDYRPSSPGRGQWAEVLRAAGQSGHRNSQSSLSSLSPSDALANGRVVPLNRRFVSPMAAGYRSGRPTSASSSGTSSDRGLLSPISNPGDSLSSTSTSRATILNGPIHQKNDGSDGAQPEPPSRRMIRKKTPPLMQSEADDTSDSFRQPITKSQRVKTRRYPPNLSLRNQDNSRPRAVAEQRTPSPNALAPEWPDDHDFAKTPKASSYDGSPVSSPPRRSRKLSGDGSNGKPPPRPVDGPPRTRKVSGEGSQAPRRTRESAAIEGDDEGYDDLLSAYESEEGSRMSSLLP